MINIESSIKIKIDNKELNLTHAQAKQLYDALKKQLGIVDPVVYKEVIKEIIKEKSDRIEWYLGKCPH